MHAVRSGLPNQFHTVIQNQCRPVLPAQWQGLSCSGAYLILRSIFHAQLYPAASAFEGDAHGVKIGDGLREMGDELYLKAHFSKIIRNGEMPQMCGGRALHSKSPYDGTDRIRFDGCNLSLRVSAVRSGRHPSFPDAKISDICFVKFVLLNLLGFINRFDI